MGIKPHRIYLNVLLGMAGVSLLSGALLAALSPSGYPAHIACWPSRPLVWLHLLGDLAVWAAYMVIPFLVLYLMIFGRLDDSSPLTFPTLIGWGVMFIWSCGLTHLFDALEIWYQVQWSRGVLKGLTGVVSWVFVGLLVRDRRRLLSVARAAYRAALEEEAAP